MQLGVSPNDDTEQDSIESKQNHSLYNSLASPGPFDLNKQNKRAVWRYRSIIVFLGIVLSFIIALFYLESALPGDPLSFRRTCQMLLANAWLIVPSIGLLERWSSLRIFLLSLAYSVSVFTLIVVVSNLDLATDLPGLMVVIFSPQVLLFPFIFMLISPKLRTLGPYLVIIFFLLVCASWIGFEVLTNLLAENNPDSWVVDLSRLTNPIIVLIWFAIAPWPAAFFPLRYLANKVARLYDKKCFSSYLYLLISLWLIVLLVHAVMLSFGLGTAAYSLLVSLLIIPLVFIVPGSFLKPKHQPPTLLLLRVFREDDGIKKLFDNVLEKWRYTGNTVMIGGKDLAIRTLEPNELFDFLNGKLQGRFISDRAHLKERVTQLDFDSDPDGRYRINEFLCFDTTWKLALDELIKKTNLVLMDLRDYHAGRKGCNYELGIIANSPHLQKLIILTNAKTDTNTAKSILIGKENETTWVEDAQSNGRSLEETILKVLLE